MKILCACEESQAVTKELRKLGHYAFSNDIIETSGDNPEWHIIRDTLELINGFVSFETQDGLIHYLDDYWDMIIAFPPYTYMSNAGACRMYPKKGVIDEQRLILGQQARDFFMNILEAPCDKICVENPRPLKVIGLPKETQRIQPYQFGEPYSKLTYLWLKGLKPLEPTNILDEWKPFVNAGSKRNDGSKRKNIGVKTNSKDRSKTFPGIAKAMAQQWCGLND